jgi:hypothetical protein
VGDAFGMGKVQHREREASWGGRMETIVGGAEKKANLM